MKPVSRGYYKLKFALENFKISLKDKVCADFGSSTGGFVQVILEAGCKKIYAVETSKNRLHFNLKEDKRVDVLDKTNALHVELSEKVDFISIDAGWTKQKLIIPNAVKNLKKSGKIISLVKPHYEIGHPQGGTPKHSHRECLLRAKNVPEEKLKGILENVKEEIKDYVNVLKIIESPIVGVKGKNKEFLMLCEKK